MPSKTIIRNPKVTFGFITNFEQICNQFSIRVGDWIRTIWDWTQRTRKLSVVRTLYALWDRAVQCPAENLVLCSPMPGFVHVFNLPDCFWGLISVRRLYIVRCSLPFALVRRTRRWERKRSGRWSGGTYNSPWEPLRRCYSAISSRVQFATAGLLFFPSFFVAGISLWRTSKPERCSESYSHIMSRQARICQMRMASL